MKQLLSVTALAETGTALAFVCCPSAVVRLLLGSSLDGPAAVTIGRLAGGALLALSVACWCARREVHSRAAAGVVAGMLLYNVAAVVLLLDARFREGLAGVGAWPTIVFHTALALWCTACLRGRKSVIEVA